MFCKSICDLSSKFVIGKKLRKNTFVEFTGVYTRTEKSDHISSDHSWVSLFQAQVQNIVVIGDILNQNLKMGALCYVMMIT